MTSRESTALDEAVAQLLAARDARGHWRGRLSTSALSTATASFALLVHDRHAANGPRSDHATWVRGGLDWLASHQNADGGWGDTERSRSNVSTTTLAWSALGADAALAARYAAPIARAESWLSARAGSVAPTRLARAIVDVYGRDRTFSVPILTMAALAGRLGNPHDAWRLVRPLPFELAVLPQRFFRFLGLPVVSYALPALIAIGQARFRHGVTRNPAARVARWLARDRSLRVLDRIQPANGGFLEATPLTSFVAMSLASMGLAEHAVTARCVEFLRRSVRADGSWPIDTDLATWATTLSIDALARADRLATALSFDDRAHLVDWLLEQQHARVHPYTGAAPGAWAWTDLPGGVPDADDTAGALVALYHLAPADGRAVGAAARGLRWLLALQNRDGGIPTFCRGWSKLPFDRSGADLTAHVFRAAQLWRHALHAHDACLVARIDRRIPRMIAFLRREQRADGSWCPLWFGNEHVAGDENPLYGTARVVAALRGASNDRRVDVAAILARGVDWLRRSQNDDGGWGGAGGAPSSIEETGLALVALAGVPECREATAHARRWLAVRVAAGELSAPAPIGFYFARLWYHEAVYPLVFAIGGLAAR